MTEKIADSYSLKDFVKQVRIDVLNMICTAK